MSSQPHIVLPWVRRNHFTLDRKLDWKGAWRLDLPPAWLGEVRPVQVNVPVPVRPARLIAQRPDLSRNGVRRRVKSAIPPNAGFTVTVMAQAYQRRRRRRA
jgi:hypothetical protein